MDTWTTTRARLTFDNLGAVDVSFIDQLIFNRQKRRIYKTIQHSNAIRAIKPEKSAVELRTVDRLVVSNLRKSGLKQTNWEFFAQHYLSVMNLGEASVIVEHAVNSGFPGASEAVADLETIKRETETFSEEILQARDHLFGGVKTFDECDIVVAIPSSICSRIKQENSPVDPADLRRIYREIFSALHRNDIQYDVCSSPMWHGRSDLGETGKYISFRTEDPGRQGLHFCTTEKKNFFSFDRKGYAGWSEFAEIESNTIDSLVPDQETVDAFFEREAHEVIGSNASKYSQPGSNVSENPSGPYIFVPLQTINDAVQQLAFMPMMKMLDEVCIAARRAGVAVVAKRHPLCRSRQVQSALKKHAANGDLVVSRSSIHDLIRSSVAVCTVNSSVGAEALLHLKPVYVFGKAAYQGACFSIREEGEFGRLFQPDRLPRDEAYIRKFFYAFRNVYELDIESASFGERLESRILRLIDEEG